LKPSESKILRNCYCQATNSFNFTKEFRNNGYLLIISFKKYCQFLTSFGQRFNRLQAKYLQQDAGGGVLKGRLGLMALLVLVLTTTLGSPVFATLGPIRVELNMVKPKISHARANTTNSFLVSVRYNQNILTHDWIKFWFPTNEANGNLENMCDELPKITGDVESPRFVPNEKYFETYPNSQEKEYWKVYGLTSRRPEILSGYNPGECTNPNSRFIADKSGLGYWMMGTLMPKLHRNPEQLKEQMAKISMKLDICNSG
jgi:hypothetical protein